MVQVVSLFGFHRGNPDGKTFLRAFRLPHVIRLDAAYWGLRLISQPFLLPRPEFVPMFHLLFEGMEHCNPSPQADPQRLFHLFHRIDTP